MDPKRHYKKGDSKSTTKYFQASIYSHICIVRCVISNLIVLLFIYFCFVEMLLHLVIYFDYYY